MDNQEEDHISPLISEYFTPKDLEEEISQVTAGRVQELIGNYMEKGTPQVKEDLLLMINDLRVVQRNNP